MTTESDSKEVVCTVVDTLGAYAFFYDETEALKYAAKVRGQLGPCMTRAEAYEFVAQQYASKYGPLPRYEES